MFILQVLIFIFGCVMGSFLNCAAYRLFLRETQGLNKAKNSPASNQTSFLKGHSFCPKCFHILGFWDLIPIFSFFYLGGKCRYCDKKISLQYLVVEIAVGGLFLLIFNQFAFFDFRNVLTLIYFLTVSSLLVIIFLYDLKHYIIPDRILFPAIGLVFLYQVFNSYKMFHVSGFMFHELAPFISAFAVAGFFFLIWAVSSGKWMGFGDVKLAFFLGLFLGVSKSIVAVFFSFCLGAIIGIILVALGKKKIKSQVPFGPFLIAGIFTALFWGEAIISWYLSLIGY